MLRESIQVALRHYLLYVFLVWPAIAGARFYLRCRSDTVLFFFVAQVIEGEQSVQDNMAG